MKNRLFLMGDTHGLWKDTEHNRFLLWKEAAEPVEGDVLLIAGDVGIFDKPLKDEIEDLCCEVIFIDGNHDNFDMLDTLPEVDRFGGKVGQVTERVSWLKRGRIYEICGKRIFCFGGAVSIDKEVRIKEGLGWWSREIPSMEEFELAMKVVKSGEHIDLVVTHAAPFNTLYGSLRRRFTVNLDDVVCGMLEKLWENGLRNIPWYCGHYHIDEVVGNVTFLYDKVIEL